MVKYIHNLTKESDFNMDLQNLIPNDWKDVLSSEFDKPYFIELNQKLNDEYKNFTIFPEQKNIFNSIESLKPSDIKVVIIGQDPYIKKGQANGLSFSVNEGVKFPKSLNNIFKELLDDVGVQPTTGSLLKWKEQGVLLLNTILTVRENSSNSHLSFGWQNLTKKIIEVILNTNTPTVFILWGDYAKKTFCDTIQEEEIKKVIKDCKLPVNEFIFQNNKKPCLILSAPHPSPLSSYRGFFGSKPFSKTNFFLRYNGVKEIDWNL